jgi:hypothetical protein
MARVNMKKTSIIQENIFDSIAKMIAAFQIQRKIGAAMSKLPDDPEIIRAAQDLKKSDVEIRTLLANFCKRNPNHPKCKENSESK